MQNHYCVVASSEKYHYMQPLTAVTTLKQVKAIMQQQVPGHQTQYNRLDSQTHHVSSTKESTELLPTMCS